MKLLIKPLMLLFLFISTVATSCSGDDDNNQDQNSSANSFFCKVDGADFNPQFVSGFNSTGVSNTILLSASINASATQTTGINIFVPNNIPTGTYSLTPDATADYYVYAQYYTPNDEFENVGESASGSLVITEHNTETNTISGTFNFVTDPTAATGATYTLTEGTFTINYSDM